MATPHYAKKKIYEVMDNPHNDKRGRKLKFVLLEYYFKMYFKNKGENFNQ